MHTTLGESGKLQVWKCISTRVTASDWKLLRDHAIRNKSSIAQLIDAGLAKLLAELRENTDAK